MSGNITSMFEHSRTLGVQLSLYLSKSPQKIPVAKEVGQYDPILPELLIACLRLVFRKIECGGEEHPTKLRIASDVAFVASEVIEATNILQVLDEECWAESECF
ncbi:hypothetical protein AB6A40_006582 [Gnathostoma spinigerum]|uniref:Uncharacterized protein n=1 Tax=Gnathostoma spinigerum TaxID=75299 RepID=A0ABD6ES77_9BILA